MTIAKHDSMHRVSFTLNGDSVSGFAEPRMLLSDFLRHSLGATGTHVGCEHGVCGACTISINGEPARACLILALQAEDCDIKTVEGLQVKNSLSDLQQCFREHFALQCGYCTPGILMSLHCWLKDNPDPTEQQVREMLSGHLCRCTGYTPIVQAALAAARKIRDASNQDSSKL